VYALSDFQGKKLKTLKKLSGLRSRKKRNGTKEKRKRTGQKRKKRVLMILPVKGLLMNLWEE